MRVGVDTDSEPESVKSTVSHCSQIASFAALDALASVMESAVQS